MIRVIRLIMDTLKKRIQQIKKKRPGYEAMLDFYQKIKEEQEKIQPLLTLPPIHLRKEWKDLLTKEGFPLLERKDFPLDIEASTSLFESLCQIGKEANPYMAEQIKKIEEALSEKKIDLSTLLKDGWSEQKVEGAAQAHGLDKKILLFFIHSTRKPSIKARVEKLSSEISTETWTKGSCPLCGSLPNLSLLKEEVGKRFLLCSYCGYQWRFDRITCPFCDNRDHESLHYFSAEGEEAYRIHLCDQCHQYIKTIDQRASGEIDPSLEDLATLHLDLAASQKGYTRPAPHPWIDQ
ncbi:MAG: formate dehydrogenase accessory protein FdhE [Thermodesulfobacteriota bacterium]